MQVVAAVHRDRRADHVPGDVPRALVRHEVLRLQLAPHVVQLRVEAAAAVLHGPAGPGEAGVERLGPPRRGGRQRSFLVLGVVRAHQPDAVVALAPHERVRRERSPCGVVVQPGGGSGDEVVVQRLVHGSSSVGRDARSVLPNEWQNAARGRAPVAQEGSAWRTAPWGTPCRTLGAPRQPHGTRSSGQHRSTRKAQAREEAIYRAAARIFHRKGYTATTLQDIADEVGILKGSLYYYIDSKEDLLFGITETIHRLAADNADLAAGVDGTCADRLRFLVERHVASFGVNLEMIRVFYTDHGALGPERRRHVMGERRRYEQFARGLITDGQRAGEFCPDLDARVANNAILTMVNTIYMWFDGTNGDLEAIARQYAAMVLGSLRCPPDHDHGLSATAPVRPARRAPRRRGRRARRAPRGCARRSTARRWRRASASGWWSMPARAAGARRVGGAPSG